MVYPKQQPCRQKSLAKRSFEKLAPRFYGTFLVIQRIRKVAYKLQLPHDCKMHLVFHISKLKKAVGTTLIPINLLNS